MLAMMSKYWWLFVLRGVLAIAFGALAFFWPGITLAALVLLFGAYVFVDGIFLIIHAISGWNHSNHHWLTLLEGLLGVGVGVLTFFAPGITALGLLIFIAAWSLATGVLEIVAAIELRKEIEGEWWLLLSGVASIMFAALLMVFPGAGALGLVWIIGAYAIVFGVLLLALGFKLLRLSSHVVQPHKEAFA